MQQQSVATGHERNWGHTPTVRTNLTEELFTEVLSTLSCHDLYTDLSGLFEHINDCCLRVKEFLAKAQGKERFGIVTNMLTAKDDRAVEVLGECFRQHGFSMDTKEKDYPIRKVGCECGGGYSVEAFCYVEYTLIILTKDHSHEEYTQDKDGAWGINNEGGVTYPVYKIEGNGNRSFVGNFTPEEFNKNYCT